jgi:hypothetical protein
MCVLGLVRVETREEKGSDVHLVSHLLRDAFLGDFEPAIEIVGKDAKLPVHVLSPYPFVVNRLRQAATSSSILDKRLMPNHLLPATVTLPDGTILTKPNKW